MAAAVAAISVEDIQLDTATVRNTEIYTENVTETKAEFVTMEINLNT